MQLQGEENDKQILRILMSVAQTKYFQTIMEEERETVSKHFSRAAYVWKA